MARFILDGRMACRFLSALPATPTAPTQAELSAGVNLIGTAQAEEMVEITGFEVQTSSIPTPGYSGTLTGNVAGEQNYPDSSIAFYKDTASETIYSALADGVAGFVAIMQDGQGDGEECDLFPVTVASRVRRPARNAPNIFDVNFAIDVPYKATQAA